MNRLKFTLNPTKEVNPTIEVSDNFEGEILKAVREATTLEIEFLQADKSTYIDGEHRMICYTFSGLQEEKLQELERLCKAMAIWVQETVNHSKN